MNSRESTGSLVWRCIYPFLIFMGAEMAVEIIMIMAYVVMNSGTMFTDSGFDVQAYANGMIDFINKYSLYLIIVSGAILVPIYAFLMKKDRQKDVMVGNPTEYTPYNKSFLLLLPVAGFAASIGFNGVVTLSGIAKYSPTYQAVEQVVYSGNIYVQILASVVAAPLVEEMLLRGLLYKRMRTRLKETPAMLISAAIFGLIHGNIVQFVYAFLLGILLCYVYEKFKTIWAPVIFHAGANLIAILITEFFAEFDAGLTIGSVMLITVISLAITFLILKLFDLKISRDPIEKKYM